MGIPERFGSGSAHTYDQLQLVAPHFDLGLVWTAGSESHAYGMLPAYVAYRTCADNLEGATSHEQLNLGAQVGAFRFRQGGGRVSVVCTRDGSEKSVVVQVRRPQVRVIEMLGTERLEPAR